MTSALFIENPGIFCFQRDLAALSNKIKILSQECERLCSTYPESSPRIRGKEREVVEAWEALLTRSKGREDKLVEAEQLQRFLNTFRDLRLVMQKRRFRS